MHLPVIGLYCISWKNQNRTYRFKFNPYLVMVMEEFYLIFQIISYLQRSKCRVRVHVDFYPFCLVFSFLIFFFFMENVFVFINIHSMWVRTSNVHENQPSLLCCFISKNLLVPAKRNLLNFLQYQQTKDSKN